MSDHGRMGGDVVMGVGGRGLGGMSERGGGGLSHAGRRPRSGKAIGTSLRTAMDAMGGRVCV